MTHYNKLIRDKIPGIIKITGKTPNIRTLTDHEYEVALKSKLQEETKEYVKAGNDNEAVKELADVLEVIHALTEIHGTSVEEVEDVRIRKKEERGGFSERTFLVDIEED